MKRSLLTVSLAALVGLAAAQSYAKPFGPTNRTLGVNVVLRTEINESVLAQLGWYGKVRDVVPAIRAVTLQTTEDKLALLQLLPFVEAVNPDAERTGAPVDLVPVPDFADGMSTWNLDAVNVTDFSSNGRQMPYDGDGVYVAVLDTGLVDLWRAYFPEERIATEYAVCFGGGGGDQGFVSQQPHKWAHDQDSHGTHVTSTILGFRIGTRNVNGVAPRARVIPVKVLNQNGRGWSSVVARGITYVADLKAGPLASHPVVINMSLGGPVFDAMEKAAIDYAISKGVIVVASAGNRGSAGMGYPGAYPPVISVGACGWIGEWTYANGGSGVNPAWWYNCDVPDPTSESDYYVADFSSRALPGQDLDVVAPGSWVVGPYQVNSGQLSYYFLGGTSMASPHVAGIVALMLQKCPDLTAPEAEAILEATAVPLHGSCRVIHTPYGTTETVCWGDEAAGEGIVTADVALALTP